MNKPPPGLKTMPLREANKQERLMWWTIGLQQAKQAKNARKKERPPKSDYKLTKAYLQGKAGKPFT